MDWKTEIQTGPMAAELAPFVAAGNDSAVAELLNAKTIAAVRSVGRTVFVRWAAKSGMRATIQDVSVDAASPLRSSALALLDIIQGGGDSGINFAEADNISMLGAWVSMSKLTPANSDALLALATIKISRADVLGATITHIDVAKALRGA